MWASSTCHLVPGLVDVAAKLASVWARRCSTTVVVLVSSLVKPKFASSAQNLLGRAHDSLQVRAWTTVESLTLFLVEGPACPVVASSSFGRERRRQIHIAPTYTCAQQRRQQTMAGAWGYTLATALVLLAASAASRAKVATDVWETSCSFLGQAKYPQVP